jgi:anti-sigma regulatory factor (Ser/Thr protein kinase)
VEALSEPTCLPMVEEVAVVRVEEAAEVGRARRVAAALAEKLGFPATRVAEIGLAVTEIGTNLHKHAHEGLVFVRSVRGTDQAAVEVVAVDGGPGIPDLARARVDGSSTTGTLGVGLGAVARLADSSAITSRPGRGTVLVARFHPHRRPQEEIPEDVAAGISRPIGSEEVCGDAYAVRRAPGRLSLMMCDGSGHGPLAASASRAAVRAFCELRPGPPEETVARLHEALRGTRGGALAVAELDLTARTVRFAGLGNIAASVLGGGQKRGMISVPGIAGHQARTIRAFDHELPDDAVVVLHSDGLTERWTIDHGDDLLHSPPLLIAATLLRDAGVRRDDACVLVGKPR